MHANIIPCPTNIINDDNASEKAKKDFDDKF